MNLEWYEQKGGTNEVGEVARARSYKEFRSYPRKLVIGFKKEVIYLFYILSDYFHIF